MPDFTLNDDALAARDAARQAEVRFLATADRAEDTLLSTELLLAEASWLHANERFADTVPTSAAGAIAKIIAVEGLLSDIPLSETSLEVRHLRAVIRFLQVHPTSLIRKRGENSASAE